MAAFLPRYSSREVPTVSGVAESSTTTSEPGTSPRSPPRTLQPGACSSTCSRSIACDVIISGRLSAITTSCPPRIRARLNAVDAPTPPAPPTIVTFTTAIVTAGTQKIK